MTGIKEDVEKRVYEFLADLGDRVGTERVQQFFEGAITGALRTKKAVDKNVESFLSLANIPSRRDYDRMRAKLDALQGSVMNLTRAVEDLNDKLALRNGVHRARTVARHAQRAKKAAAAKAKSPGRTPGKRDR